MSITGVLFLLAILVIGFVLLKFAIKIATIFVSIVILFGVACWFYPPLYEAAKPVLSKLVPFLQNGAEDASATAKAMADKVKSQQQESKND